ncbi:MAG: RsmE family RNA methyltransferase [Candidatus Gracilibacteria bacterium]|nr:RsmE family RNA methyltransferase [Candidatus Gracilibacteria bacterium]MDD2909164.1 RsmE family RNA methyltransferase [Candidatus Gracilibacteria bacterium]
MQRFYFDIELDNKLIIEDKEFFNQISFVLRSRLGDEIVLFNGNGSDYIYKIQVISKNKIELEFNSKVLNNSDPKIAITLYQALPNKYEKIDYILQKGAEVGITKFVFFKAERCSKLVISENKIARFEHIIKESIEQCGGNKKPELVILDKLKLSDINGKTLVCHTKEIENKNIVIARENEAIQKIDHHSLYSLGHDDKGKEFKINIFVGPEGGFSEKETGEFEKVGFEFINFGTRILRTETMSSVIGFWLINN